MLSRSLVPEKGKEYFPFELRSQSIKGVLRFWLRAIIPTVIDPKFYNYEKFEETKDQKKYWKSQKYAGMKKLEELIMGSQFRKSPFSLKLDIPSMGKPIGKYLYNDEGKLRLAFDRTIGDWKLNYRYAIYGTYDIKLPNSRNKYVYSFLPEGTGFGVSIAISKNNYSKEFENVLIRLFQLVSTFSGFGAKVHKGFGEFEILEPKGFPRENPEQAIVEAQNSLKGFIQHKYPDFFRPPNANDFTFPFPSFCAYEILSIDDKCSALKGDSVRSVLGRLYYNYYDHKNKKSYLGWYPMLKNKLRRLKVQGKSNDLIWNLKEMIKGKCDRTTLTTGILGLPLQYQRIRLGEKKLVNGKEIPITGKITFSPHVKGEANNQGRKASPLHISIHRRIENSSNKFFPIVLMLKSKISDGNLHWNSSSNSSRYGFHSGRASTYDNFEKLKELIKEVNKDFKMIRNKSKR